MMMNQRMNLKRFTKPGQKKNLCFTKLGHRKMLAVASVALLFQASLVSAVTTGQWYRVDVTNKKLTAKALTKGATFFVEQIQPRPHKRNPFALIFNPRGQPGQNKQIDLDDLKSLDITLTKLPLKGGDVHALINRSEECLELFHYLGGDSHVKKTKAGDAMKANLAECAVFATELQKLKQKDRSLDTAAVVSLMSSWDACSDLANYLQKRPEAKRTFQSMNTDKWEASVALADILVTKEEEADAKQLTQIFKIPKFADNFLKRVENWRACDNLIAHVNKQWSHDITSEKRFNVGDWVRATGTASKSRGKDYIRNVGDVGEVIQLTFSKEKNRTVKYKIQWKCKYDDTDSSFKTKAFTGREQTQVNPVANHWKLLTKLTEHEKTEAASVAAGAHVTQSDDNHSDSISNTEEVVETHEGSNTAGVVVADRRRRRRRLATMDRLLMEIERAKRNA